MLGTRRRRAPSSLLPLLHHRNGDAFLVLPRDTRGASGPSSRQPQIWSQQWLPRSDNGLLNLGGRAMDVANRASFPSPTVLSAAAP